MMAEADRHHLARQLRDQAGASRPGPEPGRGIPAW